MVKKERLLLEDKTQSDADDKWFRDILKEGAASGGWAIDYSQYPGFVAGLLAAAENIAPRRELREKSSFNVYEGKSVKDKVGYELIWDEPYNHILRTPEGEELSIRSHFSVGDKVKTLHFIFDKDTSWSPGARPLKEEEVFKIAAILEDAAKAWEADADFMFQHDIPFDS